MRQFLLLGLAFTIFVSAVSAGTTYGLIQAFGGGPRGEQGLQGPTGDTGLTGNTGPTGPAGLAASGTAGSLSGNAKNVMALLVLSETAQGHLQAAVVHDDLFPNSSSTDFDACIAGLRSTITATSTAACTRVLGVANF